MALQSPRFLQNARLVAASENKPSIRQGETGEAVVIVQLALIDLGNAMPNSTKKGRADGIFGPETFKTVSTFQRDSGMSADGVVGRDTLAELERRIIALVTARALAAAAKAERLRAS